VSRRALFREICRIAGVGTGNILDEDDGWPGTFKTEISPGHYTVVAMHVSRVSPHARHDYEYRFQNPSGRSPVRSPGGAFPILVALAMTARGPILVGLDGRSRVNRQARFSILFHRRILDEAEATGWSIYESSTGERIVAFHPRLIAVFVAVASAELDSQSLQDISRDIDTTVLTAGLLSDPSDEAADRTRRAATILVRHHSFGKAVLRAYGHRCAMCGLNSGLVVGAHIFPVKAPGSPDKIWNGLALCQNHHAAFDAHLLWVDPDRRAVVSHPRLAEDARTNRALASFLASTFREITVPVDARLRPRGAMFVSRYAYFGDAYFWLRDRN
jgi:hypothetical protein